MGIQKPLEAWVSTVVDNGTGKGTYLLERDPDQTDPEEEARKAADAARIAKMNEAAAARFPLLDVKARRMAKKAKQAVDEKAKAEEEARKQREAEEAAAKLAAEQKAKGDAIAKALEDPCEPGWHILLVDKVKVREGESTD